MESGFRTGYAAIVCDGHIMSNLAISVFSYPIIFIKVMNPWSTQIQRMYAIIPVLSLCLQLHHSSAHIQISYCKLWASQLRIPDHAKPSPQSKSEH